MRRCLSGIRRIPALLLLLLVLVLLHLLLVGVVVDCFENMDRIPLASPPAPPPTPVAAIVAIADADDRL